MNNTILLRRSKISSHVNAFILVLTILKSTIYKTKYNNTMNHRQSIEPTTQDILCGRGRAYVSHPGNQLFVEKVRSMVPQYMAARNRVEKSAVVARLVQDLTHSGIRFLKLDKDTQTWAHLSSEERHAKTSHAIRDSARYAAKTGKCIVSKSMEAKRAIQNTTKRSSFVRHIAKKHDSSTIRFSHIEPMCALSTPFVTPNFSRTTSDMLATVLQVQAELQEITPTPSLTRSVTLEDECFAHAETAPTNCQHTDLGIDGLFSPDFF